MKNTINFLMPLFFSLIFAMSSCTSHSTQEKQDAIPNLENKQLAENQLLRLNLFVEPPSLDPRKVNDSISSLVIKMLFEGLTRIQPNGLPGPGIAEDIEVSEDLKTYRFTIRDCKWSNGDPVTAYDFAYTWKEVLSPTFDAPYAIQMYVIKNAQKAKAGEVTLDEIGVRAINEYTLEVTLENPTPYFLELTAFPTFFAVNRSTAEKNPQWATEASKQFIGNGPFTLKSWKHHNELIVTKNKQYWDEKSVTLNDIHMIMINDENTELNLFEEGDLDWAGRPISRLPADAMPTLRKSGQLMSHPIAGVEWYKFNTGRFPFNNVNMRKAFSYAINRKEIIEKLLPDNHTTATGLIPPPLKIQDEPFFEDGNIKNARDLFNLALKELDITKEELPPITLSFNTNQAHHLLAQAIQEQWSDAFGLRVQLDVKEWKVHTVKMRKNDYMIGRLGWVGDFHDPINFLEVFKYRNDPISGGNNDTQWENLDYIKLLDTSATMDDIKERKNILIAAEKLIMDEMPVAPIYYMTDTYLKVDNLEGYYLSGLGDVDFKWAYFKAKE